MTTLHQLFEQGGQSPWLDNCRRDWIQDGQLADLVARGVRGVTSNPTIFAKAISGSDRYDEQFRSCIATMTPAEAYWELVASDIAAAMSILTSVYAESNGDDGYVSVEVAPSLARDAAGTVAAARHLRDTISGANLMVKVPGTVEGLTALRQLVADGLSINVTLLFGVASFFISRVDSEIDKRLEVIGTPAALEHRGLAAVAQARVVYQHFTELFSGARWERLAARGAQVQRPLWASTSTKNPTYPDLLYVDTLIGPNTVNTLPDATLEAFDDHGTVATTITLDPAGAAANLAAIGALGVDLSEVAEQLEVEGLASFAASFDELIAELEQKAEAL